MRLFGRADLAARSPQSIAQSETAAQLRDLERQGSGLASIAHIAAGALVILFSLGSLISLSAPALNAVLSGYAHGRLDVPSAISLAVSTLLVVAMDTAMLYAASVLRILAMRRAPWGERWVHLAVMIFACILEASTYIYMSWMYDRPDSFASWAITIARALSAPLFSVYLSMARPLPVGARDIFAQAELSAGKGVLLDVTALANDRGAPLRRKLRIYGAASSMRDSERGKLASLIDAVSEGEEPLAIPAGSAGPNGRGPSGLPAPDTTPAPDPEGEEPLEGTSGQPARRGSGRTANRGPLRVVTAPQAAVNGAGQTARRRDTGRSAEESAAIREHRLALAAQLLEGEPRMGAKRLAVALDCPKSVAGGIKREWLAERRGVASGIASGAASRTASRTDSREEQSA